MSLLQTLQSKAPKGEAEQPPDCFPGGEYPCEISGFTLAIKEGDSDKGHYRFAGGRMQLRALAGPFKGSTTFINAGGKGGFPLTIPDANAPIPDNTKKSATYFTMRATDAIGFAKKWDPTWQRGEKADAAGRVRATYKGSCMDGGTLLAIAENEAMAKELAAMLVGCKGLFRLDTQKSESSDREFQVFKSVRPLTDATMAEWKAAQGAVAAPASGGGVYD